MHRGVTKQAAGMIAALLMNCSSLLQPVGDNGSAVHTFQAGLRRVRRNASQGRDAQNRACAVYRCKGGESYVAAGAACGAVVCRACLCRYVTVLHNQLALLVFVQMCSYMAYYVGNCACCVCKQLLLCMLTAAGLLQDRICRGLDLQGAVCWRMPPTAAGRLRCGRCKRNGQGATA